LDLLELFDAALLRTRSQKNCLAQNSINWWLARMKLVTKPDQVFGILDEFKQLQWTRAEKGQMWHIYMPILETWYSNHPDGWLIDGRPANTLERIQLEKYLRGWYRVTPKNK